MRASLVFIDESGLLMSPLVRRSWAPRGQTPLLYQRTRSKEKVTSIAALTISPKRHRVGLYFSLGLNVNATTPWIIAFLRDISRHLRNDIVVIWDRLAAHRAKAVTKYFQKHDRLSCEFLPPYAPELNPVEMIWSYLKTNPMSNWAAQDTEELFRFAFVHTCALQLRQDLLRSFIRKTPLSLRLR